MWLIFPILFLGLIVLVFAGQLLLAPLSYYQRWKQRRQAEKEQRESQEQARRANKKVDDAAGEYVRFEEVRTDDSYAAASNAGDTAYQTSREASSASYRESQISDAEYEEIPE